MKVGFTGTRKGMTRNQEEQLENILGALCDLGDVTMLDEFHHGDCDGADEQAHTIAGFLCTKIVVHPPIESRYRAYTVDDYMVLCMPKGFALRPEKEYLARNRDIVDETDVLIATPYGAEELRSGTWATIRYARKQGKPVYILER